MPIANTARVLNYLPYAMGAYGGGPGTTGFAVGNARPVPIDEFKPTPNSGFQATLYKDTVTGKYTVALAGTNDFTDLVASDRVLATSNLMTSINAGSWDPQMTDAIKFTTEAFRQIQAGHKLETGKDLSLDDLRGMVTVTGHSLGGSLAELTGKFFGLNGANIDGPGVSSLIGQSEYTALQQATQAEFPELNNNYTLGAEQFGAYAYTVVGVAGTHLPGIEVERTPRALAAEVSMYTAAGGVATANPLAVALSAGVAGASALAHPSGAILAETEAIAGIAPALNAPASPYSMLGLAGPLSLPSGTSVTLGTLQLAAAAQTVQDNVSQGLSPAGLPLDGSSQQRGPYSVFAYRDAETGRISEVYTVVDAQGNLVAGGTVKKEYAVDASGRVGEFDGTGALRFVAQTEGGTVGVVKLTSDGEVVFHASNGQASTTGMPSEIAGQMLQGHGDWMNTVADQFPLFQYFTGEEPPQTVSPPPGVSPEPSTAAPPSPTSFAPLTDDQLQAINDGLGLPPIAAAPAPGIVVAGDGVLTDGGYITGWANGGGSVTPDPAPTPSGDPDFYNDDYVYTPSGPAPNAVDWQTFGHGVSLINTLMSLGQWDDLSDIQRLGVLAGGYQAVAGLSGGSLTALPGSVPGAIGLLGALDSGNPLAIASAGAQLGSQLIGSYAADMASTAWGGLATGELAGDVAIGMLDDAAGMAGVAQGLGQAVPFLNLALALESGNPWSIAASAVAFIPVWGQIAAVFISVLGMFFGDDDPPVQIGHVTASWNDAGELDYTVQRDEADGGKPALSIAQDLATGLDGRLDDLRDADGNRLLELIPGKLPGIGWHYDPNANNTDRVQLHYTDENGQPQTRYYDDQGNQVLPSGHRVYGSGGLGADYAQYSQDAIAPAFVVQVAHETFTEQVGQAVTIEQEIDQLQREADAIAPRQVVEGPGMAAKGVRLLRTANQASWRITG